MDERRNPRSGLLSSTCGTAWPRRSSPLVHVEHAEGAVPPEPCVRAAQRDDADVACRGGARGRAGRVELSDADEPHRIATAGDGMEHRIAGAGRNDAAVAREEDAPVVRPR